MRRTLLRIVTALVAILFVITAWSYIHAITGPGSESIGAKSVEWVRNHGGSSLVRWVESVWYSHHQPPVGGRPNLAIVTHQPVQFSRAALARVTHLPPPAPCRTILSSPLDGECAWTPVGRTVDGLPATYVTWLRPDTVHTSLVAGIAWMDTDLLSATLYAGTQIPGAPGFHHLAPLPSSETADLVAEFNSGFTMQDAYGGYYSEDRLIYTMRPGAATLVIYTNGRATVTEWGRNQTITPDMASVRQNLDLIVDHGKPVPGVKSDTTHRWGATLGNRLDVWRSGVGVTSNGALLYAGGPGLSVYTLASVLSHAGAVRAMELDINTAWVDYFFFEPRPGKPATPANGVKLVKTMADTTARYFQKSSRDFVALFARRQPIR